MPFRVLQTSSARSYRACPIDDRGCYEPSSNGCANDAHTIAQRDVGRDRPRCAVGERILHAVLQRGANVAVRRIPRCPRIQVLERAILVAAGARRVVEALARAFVLVNLDEPEKAIGLLETATRLDVDFLPAQAALGQALLQTGRPKLAIPHLKVALAEDEDASAHFRLLRAYQLTGQTELAAQARVEYQTALKLAEAKLRFEEGGDITEP